MPQQNIYKLYTNIRITLGITGFIFDTILFCTIVAFKNLNSRFHYNLFKHWCCLDASYLAISTLSELFLYNISYDVAVASCTHITIVNVLFSTNYLILLLIAIDWTCFVYKRAICERLRAKKNCLTAGFYSFAVFAMCFGVRNCVFPREEIYDVFILIVTVEFFVCFGVLVLIAVVHRIKCGRNGDVKKFTTFPLKMAFLGFLTWLVQFVTKSLSAFGWFEENVHFANFYMFLGICTPVFYFILCLTCDKTYRDYFKYICGCKAYDDLCHHNENTQRQVFVRL